MKAFPNMTTQQGMDLRDYFAVQMMQALIQASASLDSVDDTSFDSGVTCGFSSEINVTGEEADGTEFRYSWARYYADEAYLLADEMIRQRERK